MRRAAIYVAGAWLAYGVMETTFADFARWAVLTLLLHRATPPASPAFALTTLVMYAIAGGLIGCLAGGLLQSWRRGPELLAASDSRALWTAVGSASLVVFFAINAWFQWRSALAGAALCLALSAAALLAAWRPRWRRWRLPGSPWFIAFLLLSTAFVSEPRVYVSGLLRSASVALAAALAVAVTFVAPAWDRLLGSGAGGTGRALRRLAGPALLTVALAAPAVGDRIVAPRDEAPPRAAVAGDHRPNVILITLDTVRADHLSVYGYGRDTTPRLRRLAAECATVYSRTIAPSNHTLASHASIFTGLSLGHHGARFFAWAGRDPVAIRLSDRMPTIASMLAAAGYDTRAIVANTDALHAGYGVSRGFSRYDCREVANPYRVAKAYLLMNVVRSLVVGVLRPPRADASYISAEDVSRAAEAFDGRPRSRPFFLFLNYMDAHVPYVPPSPFDQRFEGRDETFDWARYPDIVQDVAVKRRRQLSAAERAHLVSQYDGGIAYMDQQVGALLDRLRALDLFDDTLLIITADHGESFGDHRAIGHGTTLYQDEVGVPLVVKYPGSPAPAVVDVPVSTVDIAPTILEITGTPVPQGLDGRSLRRAAVPNPRWLLTESSEVGGLPGPADPLPLPLFALVSGTRKLIRNPGGRLEVYDFVADPREVHGLAPDTLDPAWRTAVRLLETRYPRGVDAGKADPGDRERLRSLGYVR